MTIPKITLTILGATGSGKTTFLIGMYAVLSAGVNGYFMSATDPDKDLDLADDWETICSGTGKPDASSEVPVPYDFILNYGTEPILRLDCLDFRGKAATERLGQPDTPDDVAQLRKRLNESDSIFVVLDGHQVGKWVNAGCPRRITRSENPSLGYSKYITDAVNARKNAGKPSTSLVVVVTKSDAVRGITGMSSGQAMQQVLDNIEKLVPPAKFPGVTAALCPVKLGNFGAAPDDIGFATFDPDLMDPKFLHKPVIFALVHYLSEQIAYNTRDLDSAARSTSAAREELSTLRNRFLGEWLYKKQTQSAQERIDRGMAAEQSLEQGIKSARERADKLMAELQEIPIIKDGEIQ